MTVPGPLIFSPLGPEYWNPLASIITQDPTGWFYTSNGARINRVADRLLVGAAACAQDGEQGSVDRSWLGESAGGVNKYMDTTSVMEVLTVPGSNVALAAGARSSDYSSSDGVFAITAHAQNDRVGAESNAWAIYASAARRDNDWSKYTAGVEVDVTSTVSGPRASAYNVVPYGVTIGYSCAAGGETALRSPGADSGLTVFPSTVGIAFFTAGTGPNEADPIGGTGAIWDKGIVFQQNALVGTDGTNGTFGIAMELAAKHALVWANDVGDTAIGGMIRSDNTSGQSIYQSRLIFGTSRLQIKGVQADLVTEVTNFEVAANPGTPGDVVNHLVAVPNSAGNPPQLEVDGPAADIDLQLVVKGTGCLWMGSGGVNAAVPSNFHATQAIRVKDGSGAIYYIPVTPALW